MIHAPGFRVDIYPALRRSVATVYPTAVGAEGTIGGLGVRLANDCRRLVISDFSTIV
jgi:hypothetical protein